MNSCFESGESRDSTDGSGYATGPAALSRLADWNLHSPGGSFGNSEHGLFYMDPMMESEQLKNHHVSDRIHHLQPAGFAAPGITQQNIEIEPECHSEDDHPVKVSYYLCEIQLMAMQVSMRPPVESPDKYMWK